LTKIIKKELNEKEEKGKKKKMIKNKNWMRC
jgi:hypothetical protein